MYNTYIGFYNLDRGVRKGYLKMNIKCIILSLNSGGAILNEKFNTHLRYNK